MADSVTGEVIMLNKKAGAVSARRKKLRIVAYRNPPL